MLIFKTIYFFKAIKGRREIDNIKKAHIFDGIALTNIYFWLKKNYYKKKILLKLVRLKNYLNLEKKIRILNF